ncbi:sulfatase-like hydrolase/transferase [Thalassoroseus pseudoceratinae]|uniref:sulfatase-like hydrolase/transferase n=1 Tax=Thalassoroseus pseudoceratinae TaxID=2713176 RepID=UPI00141EE6B8|nr:sulfatase-like hydrolase/transferase [Thalassoroseus pseudoceratinae]
MSRKQGLCRPRWTTNFVALTGLAVMVVALGLLQTSTKAAEKPQSPNVIVILADDLGYGDLSCYGAPDLQSPNLDKLASDGLRFTNFYANCPVCSPTRAALLSGKYQDRVGVPGVIRTHANNSWGWLSPESTLLPKVLKTQGYHSAIIGKWHLGLESPNTPNERGFDWFHGFLGDMMDDYYKHRRHDVNYMRRNQEVIDPKGHATDLFTDWACDYLKSRGDESEPFFLYLAYNAPHTPIQPPAEWVEKVRQRETGISERRAKLIALIEHMDAGIGKVLTCLESTGQADNTLVIFSSDNGGQINVGANNGPTRAGKGTVYEGGLKVPTIAKWPGVIEPGTETQFTAMSMDIFTTIVDATTATKPTDLDGRSFLPTLKGKAQEPLRPIAFFRRREGGLQYQGKTIDAVRRGPWKLLQNSPFGKQELYNLDDDPLEERNLLSENPRVYRELANKLQNQVRLYGKIPWQAPESD